MAGPSVFYLPFGTTVHLRPVRGVRDWVLGSGPVNVDRRFADHRTLERDVRIGECGRVLRVALGDFGTSVCA